MCTHGVGLRQIARPGPVRVCRDGRGMVRRGFVHNCSKRNRTLLTCWIWPATGWHTEALLMIAANETNNADMLDPTLDHIKDLQKQVKVYATSKNRSFLPRPQLIGT